MDGFLLAFYVTSVGRGLDGCPSESIKVRNDFGGIDLWYVGGGFERGAKHTF